MVNLSAIRTALFVPADRPERFIKAAASGADAVILDLEDAVAISAKDAARMALITNFTHLPVIVRINAGSTAWHTADLAAVAKLDVAAAMLPKAEDAAACVEVAKVAGKPVVALIESARGLAKARDIAAAPGVVRLAFGSIDYCTDLGCAHLREVLLPARHELVLASSLAGIAGSLDGVTARLDDLSISHDDAAHAHALGMTGKLCIHPSQIAEVRRAFVPSEQEIVWAQRVLSSGDGAVAVDGNMVDEPVRTCARAILDELKER
ncbi:CoA ester lyase [Mesorhizobium sp. CCNWLW179-1]|uniref:HpcH/HpaI aldolase/citrate lyase family protein n=1 Tax=unclassified Mesorhizobium TaxID=325217 RepID=UPI003014A576